MSLHCFVTLPFKGKALVSCDGDNVHIPQGFDYVTCLDKMEARIM